MFFEVLFLAFVFFRRLYRDRLGSPNLTVRVRIAAPVDGSLVFKDLYIIDEINATNRAILFLPDIDDSFALFNLHFRDCKVMTWRETDHLANTAFAFCYKQFTICKTTIRCGFHKRTEVVD